MKYLVFVALIAAASAYERVYSHDGSFRNDTLMEIMTKTHYEEEEFGSGGKGDPDCQIHYVEFENKYLRGVTGDDHESYNETSYKKCLELCCMETRFKCQSFTHFKSLKQCFIMNVTRDDPRFELVEQAGWVHVQIVELQTTTPTIATIEYRATTTTTPPLITEDGLDKQSEIVSDPAKIVQPAICSQPCENGGKCEMRPVSDPIAMLESYCKCTDGYEGEQCERETPVATAEFQTWIIAVIVVAAVLIILLIVVCVVCHVQKKKTGEYRVFGALREWARKVRRPRKAVSSEDIFHGDDPYKHPVKTNTTLYDTIGSHGHSTSTSV